MFHHLFFNNIVTRTTNGSECLTALPSNCGGSLIKMGNKIKIPSDWERRKELLNILVTAFNLDWHLKHLLLPSCICLTAIHDRHWYWKIGYWQWTLKNYMDIYIYIQWWCWSSISQVLFLKANIVQLLVLSTVEFLKSNIVTSLLPKLANTVPELLISGTVPELMISNTVPDSLMSDSGPRY